ncbi:MAG: two-component system response regulator [Actinomycetota bacterium]
MEDGFRVFVVDDDPIILAALEELLAEDGKVETFGSSDACLDRLKDIRPDMFIIDVNLPGMDGYTLCRQLKDDFDTQDVPVTFISGSDDLETCLACYEAGGEDFIRKPFEPEELESKVRVAKRILAQKAALRDQAGYAQRTALSAMTSMGELGVVLQFLSKSFSCGSMRELGDALLGALQQYDLQGAVLLSVGDAALAVSPNGIDLPLEVAILNHVKDSGRIFQFRRRCAFNFDRLTLMVNNMPLEDADRCGRIRDNVALLAEGAAARLRAMEVEQLNHLRQQGVERALPRVRSALDVLQANYRRNCFELTQLMIEYQENLLKSFIHLGLMERQEEFLTGMAQGFMERMVGTQDQSLTIVGQLEELAGDLEKLAKD